MFLSKSLVHSCMRMHYIREENSYSYLQFINTKKTIIMCDINDCFKINGIQSIMMPVKVNMLDLKIMRGK